MRNKYYLFIIFLGFFSLPLQAKMLKNKTGVGINYPGISAKHWFENYGLGAKAQFADSVQVYGLRTYRKILSLHNPILYGGVEADYLFFKGDIAKGNGIASELFVGMEYLFKSPFSLSMDIGPSFIFLNDKDTSETESGFDVILNIGVNYYFGK